MTRLTSPVEPLRWERGRLRLLDQTRLPAEEAFVDCASVEDVVRAIRELRVRGAPLLGVTAAYGMALAAEPGVLPDLTRAAKALVASRPTAVNIRWAVDRVMRTVATTASRDIGALVLAEARRIHAEDAAMCDAIGRAGGRLVPRGAAVMTICNTGALATGGIGTAFGVLRYAKEVTVYALETRPVWQGARLTMYELSRCGLPGFLVADGAAAATMREKRIRFVVVGADRIARNGDTANKIGTYGLALAAKAHRAPFYVAAPSSTIDDACATGADIPIEERAESEVLTAAPAGARAYNPAFDVTPAKLITGIITERGVFAPRDAAKRS